MRRFALVVAIVLGAGAAEARGRAQAGFQHAYAHPSCAPWDGAAIAIVIQDAPVAFQPGQLPKPAFPFYSLNLYSNQPATGRWLTLTGRTGGLSFCGRPNGCKPQAGRVMIKALGRERIEGELRVGLDDRTGRELVFPFSAPIVPIIMPCG